MMSNPTDANRPDAPAAATGWRAQRWFWLIPAITFLVGLLLGGGVMAAAGGGDDGADAPDGLPPVAVSPAPTPSTTPADRTIVVPASCEQAAERARTALSTSGEAIQALRELNTARLQELLDRLQEAQREVERLAQQCREEVPERN